MYGEQVARSRLENSTPQAPKVPIAPIFKAASVTLAVSREKDGKLRLVYAGWDERLLCWTSHERASALRPETVHCRSLISHSRRAVSVLCLGARRPLLLVKEVCPAHVRNVWRGGKPYKGFCSLLRATCHRPEDRHPQVHQQAVTAVESC